MLWWNYYLSTENEPQLSADVKKELQKQLGNRGGGTEAVYFQRKLRNFILFCINHVHYFRGTRDAR